MNNKQIFKQLLELKENAYCKYSNFKVACLIILKNEQIIKGVNIESASYSPTICAERTAIAQLYTQGYNKADIKLFALYTDSSDLGTPCGVCRQVMNELVDKNQKIQIFNSKGYQVSILNSDLLPFAFTHKQLK